MLKAHYRIYVCTSISYKVLFEENDKAESFSHCVFYTYLLRAVCRMYNTSIQYCIHLVHLL